jgi:hypothetical protein
VSLADLLAQQKNGDVAVIHDHRTTPARTREPVSAA